MTINHTNTLRAHRQEGQRQVARQLICKVIASVLDSRSIVSKVGVCIANARRQNVHVATTIMSPLKPNDWSTLIKKTDEGFRCKFGPKPICWSLRYLVVSAQLLFRVAVRKYAGGVRWRCFGIYIFFSIYTCIFFRNFETKSKPSSS